ncbi:CapA family protein [Patescibacteria group bacterium]|nr:CapA family protein [Patescibacteria group bacterium]
MQKPVAHATVPQVQFALSEVKILAVGDMLFDRSLRRIAETDGGYLFACSEALFAQADFAVGNLEGPITSTSSQSQGSTVGSPENYIFTFPTNTANLLAAHRFGAVNLGNNHIGNFGREGIASTREYLAASGVGYFGGVGGEEPVARTDYNGIKLSFVSHNEFGGTPPEDVAQKISSEKAAGRVVVVYAHWGDEYSTSTTRLRPVAELFANAGASVVIGSHPHVVLGHEYLGQTLVYYSLGNFIFDQYWNADVSHGLALLLRLFSDGTVVAQEYPVALTPDGRTCPIKT